MNVAQFVVLEGLDGSGTSTQGKLLEEKWAREGRKCILTSEPSSGPVGQMIRQIFKGRMKFQEDPAGFDRQMAYLFAADRYDHLYNDTDGVEPMMNRGYSVISTRYYFSSFAYHCSTPKSWELVERLNADFPQPTLLVYLRNSVDESMKRLTSRPTLDSYETEDKLRLVSNNYERIVGEYPGAKLILDAKHSPTQIHEAISNRLKDFL